MSIDPKMLKSKDIERRILATLTEHPPSDERTQQIEELTEDLKAAKAEIPPEPTEEEMIEAEIAKRIEAARREAGIQKGVNEAMQAAAKASKVEGVTPETVMLQDPDAVLAVIGEKA